jgi:hypothetical protein
MKSRTRVLEARLAKLEAGRLPVPRYVVRLSHAEWDLPEADRRGLVAVRAGGRPVMVCPEKCATAEQWKARYAPH